jgi:trehalose 6-phosphate synthase/phosphatase
MSLRYIDQEILKEMKERYHSSHSRIIFIDYDGTLIPYTKFPEQAVMNVNADKIISQLAFEDRNKIVIISGRDQNFLEHQFTKANVTLIAEHGYFIKEPNGNWKTNISLNIAWKQKVASVLNRYVFQCSGSFVEEKYASLAWHFRNVNDHLAELQISKLKDDLQEVINNEWKLEILDGNKVLEIKSKLYNKGSSAFELLADHSYGFILAIGDDKTDEDLFRAMPEDAFTIKVGNSFTLARYNLKKQEQLYQLFQELLS